MQRALREGMVADARGNPRVLSLLEQRLNEAQYAPVFPAYFYIEADNEGNLWVQAYRREAWERRVWSVFDHRGVYLGDVELPERFRLFQVGADFLLGHWRDPEDVEHVRIYPIIKP